jgi:hypothetical protein
MRHFDPPGSGSGPHDVIPSGVGFSVLKGSRHDFVQFVGVRQQVELLRELLQTID